MTVGKVAGEIGGIFVHNPTPTWTEAPQCRCMLYRASQRIRKESSNLSIPLRQERTREELRALQLEDPHLRLVLEAKENDKCPTKDDISGETLKTRKLVQILDQLSVSDGVLMRDFYDERRYISFKQFVVPSCLQSEVLDELHVGATSGEEKTLNRLKQRFYWPGHYRDVLDWCSTCATRKTSAPKNRSPLTSVTVGNPGQILSVDIVGPFAENCNHKLLFWWQLITSCTRIRGSSSSHG